MPITKVPDGEGGEMMAFEYQGIYLPPFSTDEHFAKLPSLQLRPDDILLCSYPKSGTHWMFEMLNMLVEGKAEPVKVPPETRVLEFPTCSLEVFDGLPSPRVLMSHLPLRCLPASVLESKCRLVVVERNLKDVMVSMHSMLSKAQKLNFKTTWNNFPQYMLSGKGISNFYFEHVKGFRQAVKDHPDNPIATFRYEKIKQDHLGELTRLSKFLGLERSPQLLADIAALTDFQSMKKYKQAETSEFKKELFKSQQDAIYRKGEVGDWKNWFTVAQSEMVDAEFLKQMGEPFQEV